MMGGAANGDFFGLMSEMAAMAENPMAGGGAGGDGRSKGSHKDSSGSGSALSSPGGRDQQKWSWKRMGWAKVGRMGWECRWFIHLPVLGTVFLRFAECVQNVGINRDDSSLC